MLGTKDTELNKTVSIPNFMEFHPQCSILSFFPEPTRNSEGLKPRPVPGQ